MRLGQVGPGSGILPIFMIFLGFALENKFENRKSVSNIFLNMRRPVKLDICCGRAKGGPPSTPRLFGVLVLRAPSTDFDDFKSILQEKY